MTDLDEIREQTAWLRRYEVESCAAHSSKLRIIHERTEVLQSQCPHLEANEQCPDCGKRFNQKEQ